MAELAPCPICAGNRGPAFEAVVLHRIPAHYASCPTCGLLQAVGPTWLEAAYTRAVVDADTGQLQRNLQLWHQVTAASALALPHPRRILDIAGGHGALTRLLRDAGFDARWSDENAENVFARGFEDDGGQYDLVTAVEVMEHLEDPLAFLRTWLDRTATPTILFTTELFEGPPPPPSWWYYTFATGQHISFFQRRTLVALGERLGRHLTSAHGLHALSTTPIDERRFGLATSRLAPVIARLARRRRPSLMWADHERMLAIAADEA